MPHRRYHRYDPRRYYVRTTGAFGRRGAVLGLFGLVWLLQGLGVLLTPPSPTYALLSGWEWPRAAAWIVTGGVALWYARRPQGEDAPGFLALYLMAAYRLIAYGVGFVAWFIPGGTGEGGRAIVGLLSWATILGFILLIAGWDEPERNRPSERCRT